jgi:hypothetical protein
MGMFDSVIVHCPACGEENEFQSKAGDCSMKTYNQTHVPVHIANDIDGEITKCWKCDLEFMAKAAVNKFVHVRGIPTGDLE